MSLNMKIEVGPKFDLLVEGLKKAPRETIAAMGEGLGVASKDTILEETLFRINRVEPVAECPACQHLYTPEGMFSHCPECNKQGIKLIRGTELQIKSLLVE